MPPNNVKSGYAHEVLSTWLPKQDTNTNEHAKIEDKIEAYGASTLDRTIGNWGNV